MSVCVLALDLEGTLIHTTYDPKPRPGLREFLSYCCAAFPRVALFTAASPNSAFEALQACVACGDVPLEFLDRVEYVRWKGAFKDLRFVLDAEPHEVLLVDDNPDWIHPDQTEQWVSISEYTLDAEDGDAELERVRKVLEKMAS